MSIRRTLRLLLAVLLTALVAVAGLTQPAHAVTNVYVEPGYHTVNGRNWYTWCEQYSSTIRRCTATIEADQVTLVNGKYVKTRGYVFNNLTYLPVPRAWWAGNRLAMTGTWTAADGRKWRTECDTAITGGNACRSYVTATVVQGTQNPDGTWRYAVVKGVEVFNNMVLFSAAPSDPGFDPARIQDAGLRSCLTNATGVRSDLRIATDKLNALTRLDCTQRGIRTLAGLPPLPKLAEFYLARNSLTRLAGMPTTSPLVWLDLSNNALTSLAGLPSLNTLTEVDLRGNRLTSLSGFPYLANLNDLDLTGNLLTSPAGLPNMPRLGYLHLESNRLTSLAGLPSLSGLTRLWLQDNQLTGVADLPLLGNLARLNLENNRLGSVAPLLAQTPTLDYLWLAGNPNLDDAELSALRGTGCIVYS